MEEVSAAKTKAQKTDTREMRLYELGYHLVPTIAEEAVADEAVKVKDSIEAHGGIIISQEMPSSVSLAYPLPKIAENKKAFYNSAYFGWVRFQALPDESSSLHEDVKRNSSILRFLLLKIVQEKAARTPKKMKFFSSPMQFSEKKKKKGFTPEKSLSEEEIDKTIEELVVE